MKIVLTMIGMKNTGTTITMVIGVANVAIGSFGITATSLSSLGPAKGGRYLRKRSMRKPFGGFRAAHDSRHSQNSP